MVDIQLFMQSFNDLTLKAIGAVGSELNMHLNPSRFDPFCLFQRFGVCKKGLIFFVPNLIFKDT